MSDPYPDSFMDHMLRDCVLAGAGMVVLAVIIAWTVDHFSPPSQWANWHCTGWRLAGKILECVRYERN